jgi:hypothetical protein
MRLFSRGYKSECAEFHEALERVSSAEQSEGPVTLDNVTLNTVGLDTVAPEAASLDTFLARLPEHARQHVSACSDCRSSADELLQVREMFRHQDTGAQPGPYFLARVMATIAHREAELEKSSQTWAAVPRLAYRLSILASLTLLVAGSWLYQQPRHATVASVSAAQSNEGLVEGGAITIQDDPLLNSTDR